MHYLTSMKIGCIRKKLKYNLVYCSFYTIFAPENI